MGDEEVRSRKVKGKTAIPTGVYKVRIDVVSPRYSKSVAYEFCGGKVPRLMNVPGFSGVLIHIGNSNEDTAGCILVGKNVVKGGLLYSTISFHRLYKRLAEAGGDIVLEVRREA